MNDVLHQFINSFVIEYLNDILFYSSTWKEHVVHLKQVFQVLHRENLLLKISKYKFGKEYLVYLDHVISHGPLKIDPTKVNVIVDWTRPSNIMNLHH